MSSNNRHPLQGVPRLHLLLATCGGIGLVPVAPGTAAAIVALVVWLALYFLLAPPLLLAATLLLVGVSLLVGVWTDNVMEQYWGVDSRAVVIDESFGAWLSLLAVQYVAAPPPQVVVYAVVAVALYRVVDIWKPLGCRWIDRHTHGGWGCMLDDALAGAYAALLTLLLRLALAYL